MVTLTSLEDPILAEQLAEGAIAVIPTDTVYGVVARADLVVAVQRLYRLKSRERKPGTLIAANINQLVDLGIKRRYLVAVEHFWPNPVSIIIPTGHELAYLDQGLGTLAMRLPKHQALQGLLLKTGPLITSSANQPGEPPANTLAEAISYFGDGVDMYVDGGDLSGQEPSTVIRVIDDAIEVVRPGALAIDETGKILS